MARRYPRRLSSILLLLALCLVPGRADAEGRLIVRATQALGALSTLNGACSVIGCTVKYRLDGSLGRLFLIALPEGLDPMLGLSLLETMPGIAAVELDQIVRTQSAVASGAPEALFDKEPVGYWGTTVRGGYVRQPAADLVGIPQVQRTYGLTGRGVTVAIIDTGVDPQHPVLWPVLLPGYDFTRNREGGSERSDVNQSTMAILDGEPGFVNQSTMAILDQSTMAILDSPEYAAFGHGTMVAGIIRLVAPRATILPLKAFRADGSGYSSDVLRAIYVAVQQGAKVINMSFNFQTRSRELEQALKHAAAKGIVAVASAGNDGKLTDVYPASLPTAIGVASSTNWDTLSSFSNFGPRVAWIASPGEGIVTTYPLGTYAAAWGTSFSAPFAAGTAALLAEVSMKINFETAPEAEGHSVWISDHVATGRLHAPSAVRAWRSRLGLH